MRIYALAKELGVDSKELVEHCRKAGIPGKGSALASLDDDEVVKLKAYLSGDSGKSGGTPDGGSARAGAPVRPDTPETYTRDDYIAPGQGGKIRVIGKPKRAATKPAETPESPAATLVAEQTSEAAEEVSVPESESTETDESIVETVETAATEEATPETEAPLKPVQQDEDSEKGTPIRTDPLRPDPNRPLTLKPEGPKRTPSRQRKRREPVIKLASLPEAKQPSPKAKPAEPKAQKPEIRLPKDAIAGHKTGNRAPLEELQNSQEAAAKSGRGGKKGAARPAPAEPVVDAPLSGKGTRRRRGGGGAEEEKGGERGLAGMASARADRHKARKMRRGRGPGNEEDREASTRSRRPRTLTRRRNVNTAAPRKENVSLTLPCSVRTFSEATGVSAGQVLMTLVKMGIASLNINSQLDREGAELLASELGVDLEFKQQETLEHQLIDQIEDLDDDPESLEPRPPVVTFLGHVDHGKTSLLDYIIGTSVVSGEAGGITQHIRAYEITKGERKIAFVDTPGHEAFTEMRARGANVTDIAVLVVAADDGIMPQTEEAISHAKAAGVPIIVALNKIDLPGVDANRTLQQLAAADLLPSEWGGDVEVVRTSATSGEGMDELLETILVTAELHEYVANPKRAAVGVCLEAEQEAGRGVIAKLIVNNGTLRVGDVVVCGSAYGRIKAMYDTLRPKTRRKKAGPSVPVNVTGFDEAPQAGERFYVLDDISQAREIAESRSVRSRAEELSGGTTKVSFEEFQRRLSEGNLAEITDIVTLNLILRADVRGSIEAIEKELGKLDHPEVEIRILHKSVGAITAADVMLAHASQAVVIGFNVIPDEAARSLADEKQVEIRRYDVIYKVTDDIKAMLEGRLKPEERIVELGHALVKRVFPISKIGAVAGCYVLRGSIARGCRIRVNRDGRTIGDYELGSLRREKDDVKEVPRGMECGIKLAGFDDIKQDDILEAYRIEEVARTL